MKEDKISHAHCRCMNIGNTCPNRHYADCDLCIPNGNQLRAMELLKKTVLRDTPEKKCCEECYETKNPMGFSACRLCPCHKPEDKKCLGGCGFQAPYGFVPEADCPIHDVDECCHSCSTGGRCEKQDGACACDETGKCKLHGEPSFIDRKISEFREKFTHRKLVGHEASGIIETPIYKQVMYSRDWSATHTLEKFLRTALEEAMEPTGMEEYYLKGEENGLKAGRLAMKEKILEMIGYQAQLLERLPRLWNAPTRELYKLEAAIQSKE